MWDWIKARGKAFGATAIAVVVVAQAALSGDGRVSGEEALQIVSAFATAAGVYLVPEVPQWPWMKTALAALFAATTTAQSLLLGGFSSADGAAIALAVLNVLVVQVLPAESTPAGAPYRGRVTPWTGARTPTGSDPRSGRAGRTPRGPHTAGFRSR